MRMSLSSSPVWGCGARPQPRSSRMPAADTRAAGGTASWLTIPASTLMHSSVCPRASDRKSAGIFFRGKGLRGRPPPSCWRSHQTRIRVGVGHYHANNLTQKAHPPDGRCGPALGRAGAALVAPVARNAWAGVLGPDRLRPPATRGRCLIACRRLPVRPAPRCGATFEPDRHRPRHIVRKHGNPQATEVFNANRSGERRREHASGRQ